MATRRQITHTSYARIIESQACPHCKAGIGKACVFEENRPYGMHYQRRSAFLRKRDAMKVARRLEAERKAK